MPVELRVPTVKEGGWVSTPQGLDQHSIVYSPGVGEDIEFDLVINRRHEVSFLRTVPRTSAR